MRLTKKIYMRIKSNNNNFRRSNAKGSMSKIDCVCVCLCIRHANVLLYFSLSSETIKNAKPNSDIFLFHTGAAAYCGYCGTIGTDFMCTNKIYFHSVDSIRLFRLRV